MPRAIRQRRQHRRFVLQNPPRDVRSGDFHERRGSFPPGPSTTAEALRLIAGSGAPADSATRIIWFGNSIASLLFQRRRLPLTR